MPPTSGLSDAGTVYAGTDPLVFAVGVCAVLAAACIVLPAYVAWQARGTPLHALDGAAAVAFVLLLLGETVADQQLPCPGSAP